MAKRWTALAAAGAAAASLAGLGYYWLLRRPLPRTQGTQRLSGLIGEVEVLRDQWGIPHIYAGSARDLFFAQGYVHAQDRLWQMEFQRRLVAGRLSELFGAQTVPVDRWFRTLTMRRAAEQEVELLDPATRALLEGYCQGVNARITQGSLPIEFTLLRHRPEPWTVADSLSWAKMMAWVLSVNWEAEILRAQLIERLGAEAAAELDAGCRADWPWIVPADTELAAVGSAALDRAAAARPFAGPPAHAGLGSNSWVLGGARTASGAPLLANDMHLTMNLPCIWYENHLVCGPEGEASPDCFDVTGVTFPGILAVVAGHNGHVAWGFTNGFPDVQDLYQEHVRRTADGRVEYEYQGQWLAAQLHREHIVVRGSDPVVEEVVVTRHGPVINGLAPDLAGEQPLALRWTALEPEAMIEGLLDMVRARTCLEFREALHGWGTPVQNVVYADTGGNIAYTYAGKVPIRARGDGLVPVPGWTGEYEWVGYVPFEELPHLYNPPQGYVVTANNEVVQGAYPHYFGREFCQGDRAQRAVELIEAHTWIDINYLIQMQFDLVSPTARTIARHLGGLRPGDPELAAVVERMRDWDGTLDAGSPEAAVEQVFVRRLIALLLAEPLGDLAVHYAGKGPTPLLAEGTMFGAKSWTWLLNVLDQPDSHWFDLGQGQDREAVLGRALRETVDFLKVELGPKIDDWAWGKLHTLTYDHILGRVKPLDRILNRGPYPLGGDQTTLWATGGNLHDLGGQPVVAPPFRFVADLGALRHSWGLLAPGQSGQVSSPHYDDQVQAWFAAGYHPMLYAREDVEQGAAARLLLVPLAVTAKPGRSSAARADDAGGLPPSQRRGGRRSRRKPEGGNQPAAEEP